jgi:hypothetical protein
MMTGPTLIARRLFALVMLLSGLLSLIGFVALPASGWPATAQGMSAAEAFPIIAPNLGAFRLGYAALTLAGILFIPAAVYILQAIRPASGPAPLWLQTAAALAIASGALRVIWYAASLTVVPTLMGQWEGADVATRAAIDVVYISLNDLLSTVQEDIGVNFLGATFTLIVAAATLRGGRLPRWTGALALVASLAYLISSSELVGLPNPSGLQALGPALSAIWLMALGVIELLRSRTPAAAFPARAAR